MVDLEKEIVFLYPEINSACEIWRSVFSPEKCKEIYDVLEQDCIVRHPITMYGKVYDQPRTNCVYSDPHITEMRYSTVTIETQPWNPLIQELRELISTAEFYPDSCLVNGYIKKEDRVSLHRDKYLQDGNNIVCTVSFGGSRRFVFKPYKKISCPVKLPDSIEIVLNEGDVVYFYGDTNVYLEHEIPTYRSTMDTFPYAPRYSATFRQIQKRKN